MGVQRCSFLEDLPPYTNEYRYPRLAGAETVISREYCRFLDGNKSPCVLFTHMPRCELKKPGRNRQGRVDYICSLDMLVLTILCLPHEEADCRFGGLVTLKAAKMNIYRHISFRGATRANTPEREKEADSSWAPRRLPQGRSWLHELKGDVTSAISVDIKRPSGNIYITSWERGIVPTRHHPYPDLRVVEELKIFRGKNRQPPPPRVEGMDIVIPFYDLLLRPPNPAHGETDLKFTKAELLEIAEVVWEDMDRM
ncbi:hypothetical protein MGYG_06394 [Nannizzia gypsea CBS 118893]|uniref:Uncharacterized protein n=1 Tax=Arthroderma gypseum (strain ATCC MYA-4604 / CBS 118893) TaxID=535722 RepID=E4UZ65_ARTGP|nr:hypothetical protein MGYG_06394 [Nannizzia gypsea CBS 118893]EFR03395.1 hypothetical protein MGYG_06394 [Nannizzia gypsea CBS 118893]